ncbi:MAG: M48 family metalloprotease [Nitrospinae bacterium]|nr:M48 family metalloprotease [Nitrospinota bacterium]
MRSGARAIVSLLTALIVIGASGPARALYDGADEEEIGRENDKAIVAQYGLVADPDLQQYVTTVGKRVLRHILDPEFDYQFKVIDADMVNAFALPGGYIYVTRGLLAAVNSEAELANILGHEIGHVVGHHSVKQMKKSLGSLLLTLGVLAASEDARQNAGAWVAVSQSLSQQIISGYGRENEMESDRIGMIAAYDAGYDPAGMSRFLHSLRRMERQKAIGYHGFMASHPDTVSRIIEADQASSLLKTREKKAEDFRDRYLEAIAGLPYGKVEGPGGRPPYTIQLRTVAAGESWRSLTAFASGDEGLAIETAALNGADVNDPLTSGMVVKTIVPVRSKTLELHEEKSGEIGPRTGDGKGGQNGGADPMPHP